MQLERVFRVGRQAIHGFTEYLTNSLTRQVKFFANLMATIALKANRQNYFPLALVQYRPGQIAKHERFLDSLALNLWTVPIAGQHLKERRLRLTTRANSIGITRHKVQRLPMIGPT